MARFYINLFNDIDTPDEEGVELADLAAAKAMAIKGGRELMADHVLQGRPLKLHHRVEIADGNGKVLAVLPFRELITIVD